MVEAQFISKNFLNFVPVVLSFFPLNTSIKCARENQTACLYNNDFKARVEKKYFVRN